VKKAFTVITQILGAFLPGRLKRALFRRCLGWSIGKGTALGFSIFLCERIEIGSDCRIGHFNMFRDLKSLATGDRTQFPNFNDFMAGKENEWPRSLWIGNNSQVTSHHFFDCSDGNTGRKFEPDRRPGFPVLDAFL
jgi:hypothetical protein